MEAAGIEVVHCTTAEEFMRQIDPTDQRWGIGTRRAWAFRGQADAEWPLMPTAWRPEGQRLLRPWAERYTDDAREVARELLKSIQVQELFETREDGEKRLTTHLAEVAAEYEAVHRFAAGSDDIGLSPIVRLDSVPDGREFLIRRQPSNYDKSNHTPKDLNPTEVDGLARHHGIPSRLLDWTFKPYVAALFASYKLSLQPKLEEVSLAVWAVPLRLPGKLELNWLTPEKHTNGFLHAQQGLFLYHRRASLYHAQTGIWAPLENRFAILDYATVDRKVAKPVKFTLPRTEADELLQRLFRHDVTPAQIMPSYGGVTETVFLQARLEEHGGKGGNGSTRPIEQS